MISLINEQLWIGHFDVWPKDGVIMFRHALLLTGGAELNPTQCEAMTMVCVQVHGATAAVGFAGSQGNFELNVYKPVIIYNFLHSVTLITDACHGYVEYMIEGIEVDRAKVDWYVKNSLMLVTALAPKVGYDKAAQIAHTAHVEHSSLREAALKLRYLTGEEFDQLMKPERMTRP